jgi:hypothetical protein
MAAAGFLEFNLALPGQPAQSHVDQGLGTIRLFDDSGYTQAFFLLEKVPNDAGGLSNALVHVDRSFSTVFLQDTRESQFGKG